MTRIRRWALVAGATLLGLLSQEAAVRLALPAYDPSGHLRFIPSHGDRPPLGIPNSSARLVKNSGDYNIVVRFNSRGLRDKADIAEAKPDDIVVVGDSYAFGWGVAERERVSEQLADRLQRKVYNLAVPTDIAGYQGLLSWAEGLGARFGQVVLLLNMTDDLVDYDRQTAPSLPNKAQSSLPPPRTASSFLQVKEFLLSHSALYFMTTSLIQQQPELRALALRFGLVVPIQAPAQRHIDEASLKSAVARLQRISKRWHVLVAVIPHRGVWIGNDRERESALHSDFIARMRAAGIDVLDLKPVWEEGDPLARHFINDAHWNATGHALAARAIATQLISRPVSP